VKVLTALLLILPTAAQNLSDFSKFVGTSDLRIAVIDGGRVVWRKGKITERAPEEPVIAERIPQGLLDTPAPMPPGATVRQVLENKADGTPGAEVLDNRSFFEALKPMARGRSLPDAVKFASENHGPLGWFTQDYAGERILWSYGPAVLIVRIPNKQLALVVSGNADVDSGNIARSNTALAFFKDVVGLQVSARDELIAQALAEFYRGQRDASAALARQALDKFPGLESTPDVTLLYLFAQLGLPETQSSATAVIRDHPSLPTAWFYYGQFLENSKRYREAAACFEKITMHQPPWHHWTVAAARQELMYLKTY
jgi:tetratricopeptide (TPR) repeat protein